MLDVDDIAFTVINAYRFDSNQWLRIRIVYGFDFGVASGERQFQYTAGPSHWDTMGS
jgi:hypothetical protein